MLTRVAIYEGSIELGTEDAFFQDVAVRLEPIWRSFPNVLDVRVQRVMQSDRGAIPIVMVLEMDFADMAAIESSLASDIKTRSHALTLDVLKPFSGRFFHYIADAWSVS